MLRQIVYAAVVEDCLALAAAAGGMPDAIREIAEKNPDFAHLGNVDGMDDAFYQAFADKIKENRTTGFDPDMVGQQLAFQAGRLCRTATDAVFAGLPSDKDAAMMQDARVFRARFLADDAAIAALGLSREDAVAQMTEMLRAFVKRAVMRTHTFKPGYEDIHVWLARWYNKSAQYDNEVGPLARMIIDPDPALVARAVTAPGFFDASEPLVKAAKALRGKAAAPADGIAAALSAQPVSLYARALKQSYESLAAYAATLS
ncbi:MAG: hypothetical protein KBA30_09805 [Clostridia bacterium]|nr:hypothetical protein [Clostridia bacterium]